MKFKVPTRHTGNLAYVILHKDTDANKITTGTVDVGAVGVFGVAMGLAAAGIGLICGASLSRSLSVGIQAGAIMGATSGAIDLALSAQTQDIDSVVEPLVATPVADEPEAVAEAA